MTFKEIGDFLKGLPGDIIHCTLLMRLKVDRYLPHIIITFIMFWLCIWTRMEVEKTMTTYEDNKVKIKELRVQKAQLDLQYAGLFRISKIEGLLEKANSDVTFPEEPASTIK